MSEQLNDWDVIEAALGIALELLPGIGGDEFKPALEALTRLRTQHELRAILNPSEVIDQQPDPPLPQQKIVRERGMCGYLISSDSICIRYPGHDPEHPIGPGTGPANQEFTTDQGWHVHDCPHTYAEVRYDGAMVCRHCGEEIVEEMGG